MTRIPIIILSLLATASIQKISDISHEELGRLTAAHLNARELVAEVAEAFSDFYTRSFEGKANIQENLRAMMPDQRAKHFESINLDVKTEEDFINKAKKAVAKELNSIAAGKFDGYLEEIMTNLLSISMWALKGNLRADKSFLYELLLKTIDVLKAELDAKLVGINSPSVMHGLSGEQYDSTRWATITKLRRFHIKTQLNKVMLIITITSDRHNHFSDKFQDKYSREVDVTIVDSLKDDLKEEFDDYIIAFVAPMILQMFAKKMNTSHWVYWNFINLRINTLLGKCLRTEHQKIVFRMILKVSLSHPGQNLDNTEFAHRFKRFIIRNFENGSLQKMLSERENKFLYMDYLACKPEELEKTFHSLEMFELFSKYTGNINNYLFFMKFFKYFVDNPSEGAAHVADIDGIYKFLYKVLLEERISGENVGYSGKEWSKYISTHFYGAYKNNEALGKYIPVTVILSALTQDKDLRYYGAQYNAHDKELKYFNVISANDDFLIDYIRFLPNSKGQYPHTKYGTVRSIIIPEVSDLTDDEYFVLSHPNSSKVIKEALQNGKNLLKMTEFDSGFSADEEVYVFLHEREGTVCNQPGCKVIDQF